MAFMEGKLQMIDLIGALGAKRQQEQTEEERKRQALQNQMMMEEMKQQQWRNQMEKAPVIMPGISFRNFFSVPKPKRGS